MNPRPIEAEAIDNKTLLVKFHNGEMKKVDFLLDSTVRGDEENDDELSEASSVAH